MSFYYVLKQKITTGLENLRLRVSHAEALPQLAVLGLFSGILTGLIIVAFQFLIEIAQLQIIAGGNPENYEQLGAPLRFLLPVAGGLVLGLLFHWASRKQNFQLGIIHVMERLAYYQGNLPLRHFILQFMGASVSIIAGHSVGREGPSVHLGAATGSLLGQYLRLPNNALRVLVGSGTAAAIAASFNTPLAGVIFALEVVMLEYTLASFIPVILAAVSATTIMQMFMGSKLAFTVPPMGLVSLTELPFIILSGVIIGILATVFIALLQRFSRYSVNKPILLRLLTAGVFTGLFAVHVPQIMGIGYDTVNDALTGTLGSFGIQALILLLAVKILVTTFGLGLGLPAGLIGPTLFIGAISGTLLGIVGGYWNINASPVGYYALLGMGAMMGACLQAPLAALTAMLELTANPQIILPGMLIIVFASLTSRVLFGKKSVFLMIMESRGMDYRNDPISISLRSTGVAGAMDRDIATLDSLVSLDKIQLAIEKNPHWFIILENDSPKYLMPGSDLARQLLEIREQNKLSDAKNTAITELNLVEIPAKRLQLAPIELQANLQQAVEKLEHSHAEALYVHRRYEKGATPHIYGVLTGDLIEASYRP